MIKLIKCSFSFNDPRIIMIKSDCVGYLEKKVKPGLIEKNTVIAKIYPFADNEYRHVYTEITAPEDGYLMAFCCPNNSDSIIPVEYGQIIAKFIPLKTIVKF